MIKYLHSVWAGFVLIVLVFTIIQHLTGVLKGRMYNLRTDFRMALFAAVIYGFQIILGLLAWFTSDYFTGIRDGHFGEYMKNAHSRLLVLEHPFMGLLGLLLVLYGLRRSYFQVDPRRKFLSIVWLYSLALLLILLRIPWSDWL